MTKADLSLVAEKGIRTQIDLRRSDEIDDQGVGPLVEIGVRYVRHPVIPDGGSEVLNKLVGATGISGERYLGYLSFCLVLGLGLLNNWSCHFFLGWCFDQHI